MDNEIQSVPPFPPYADHVASAAWRGSYSNVAYYIEKFPAQLETPSAGRTPLLWAISSGRPDVALLFLNKGASLTRKTADEETALTCAVWSASPEMVQFVLDRAVIDPLAAGMRGKTPLDWARERGLTEIIKLLEEPTRVALANFRAAVVARQQKKLADIARRRKEAKLKF